MPKVLFIVPYPVKLAPSQRFRVELYEPYLQEAGIKYKIASFLSTNTWNILYKKGSSVEKIFGIIWGYMKRIKHTIWDAPRYDYVFVHREAAPLGPPVFEWIIAKLWRKKIIYDFDDAIWIPNTGKEKKIAAWLKANWKVKKICKWSYKVVGGNDYLCNYALQFNKNVVLIPTCVDMQRMHNRVKEQKDAKITIGWTGSHSTLVYLKKLVPAIQNLQKKYHVNFLVIANKKPKLPLQNWTFINWDAASEIDDLLQMDIGVMPLEADKWSEGKCGFKLIQYLSLGIPAVASPVGVNKIIIEDGKNGFLGSDQQEWESALEKLINDKSLRQQFGSAGREKMMREYSIESQKEKFLNLFS